MYDKILFHLDNDYTEPIRDPIWKHIYLSDALAKIVSLKPFQDLNDIKQLGPAYLVYPGATHTRLAHSLGTFHTAKRIIYGLLGKGGGDVFTFEGVKAFFAAALLHDLGHYPYAHALKNLGVRDHEELTGEIVLEKPVFEVLKNDLKVAPRLVASIVDTSLPVKDNEEISIYRKLLSGVLDPDKLDYLNRDAFCCGVPYGIQDVDFFLSEIIFDRQNGFALSQKGLTAVENILFSKYLMYKTVYWHKTVRIATAMIKKALFLAVENNIFPREKLYHLTDTSFLQLLASYQYPPLELIGEVFSRQLYKQVALFPFDPHNRSHSELEDLSTCRKKEAAFSRELQVMAKRPVGEHDVIIDLPERISFEIDLPIALPDGLVSFKHAGSVFRPETVTAFTESLRYIRVYVRNDENLLLQAQKICLESGLQL